MSKFSTLVLSASLVSSALQAETVLLSGSGTITAGLGNFQRSELPIGSPISFRVTYDDQATAAVSQDILGISFTNFNQNINLNISISAGPLTWTGLVTSAPDNAPLTFTTLTSAIPTGAEVISLRLDSEENGTFSSFPFRLSGEPSVIELTLSGQDNSFLGTGISVADIDLSNLETLAGTISSTDANTLDFEIDLTSVNLLFERDEMLPFPAIIPQISVAGDSVSLTWQSDALLDYVVESTDDLSSATWTTLETIQGTGTNLTHSLVDTNSRSFFRVITQTRPPNP